MPRAHELAELLIAASPSSLTRSKHLLVSSAAPGVDHDLERAILENARIRCTPDFRSEEHTSELQSQSNLVCRLLLEKKKNTTQHSTQAATHNPSPLTVLDISRVLQVPTHTSMPIAAQAPTHTHQPSNALLCHMYP